MLLNTHTVSKALLRLTGVLLLILQANSLSAEIYTWVDENGKKHMSDKAPEGHQAAKQLKTIANDEIKVNTMSESAGVKNNRERLLESFAAEDRYQEKEAAKKEKADAKLQKQCSRVKKRLRRLQDGWRFFNENEDGSSRSYMGEEERVIEIKKMQEWAKNCQ